MRRHLLTFIAACLYYSGIVACARWLARYRDRDREPCLVILNYHRATGGDLRRHLFYLRQHYRIMHIETALQELDIWHTKGRQRSKDRRTPLALTFDDGYRDNYTHAFALACQWHIPLSIYLIPGYIESGAYFWWLEGERLVQRAQVHLAHIEGRTYHLDIAEERTALTRFIDTRVRYARSVRERECFLSSLYETLAVGLSPLEEQEMAALPLTWEQVLAMEKSGWVSFGAHTMHHPILACLADPQELQHEVEACRDLLELRLGHPIRSFAYPIGQRQHIGNDVLQAVQQAGYQWAVTTCYGRNTSRSHPLLLHRIEVDVSQHWLVLAAETAGLWGFFSRLRWLPLIRKYLTNSNDR